MFFVKRNATKAARKLPPNFEELKMQFLERITTAVKEENIPDDLILNWIKLAPVTKVVIDKVVCEL